MLTRLFQPDYMRQPPAYFYPRILVGAGDMLTPAFVEKYRITHVINCAHNDDSPNWWRIAYPDRYIVLNAVDAVTVNILDWYPMFEETLHRFLREGSGCVYVHCQAGMNRSASLALAYSCVCLGMDFHTLVNGVRRQRPCVLKNPVFMDQVLKFVNGRLQSPKASGDERSDECQRDTGLSPSGDRAEPEGLQVHAGSAEERTREPAI